MLTFQCEFYYTHTQTLSNNAESLKLIAFVVFLSAIFKSINIHMATLKEGIEWADMDD